MRAAALHVDEFPVRNDDCETQPDAEVAFAGRSNVGKSSLLKALSLRGTRVSIADRPGTTRSVNFYDLGVYLSLVDLPGYGFAFAKPEQVQSWIDIMTEYFRQRVGLKRVILLLDARFGIKDSDVSLMRLLDECRVKYQVVLTKADLLKPVSLARRLWLVREELRQHHRYAMHDAIMLVSSQNRRGLQDLRKQLVALVPPKKVQRLKNRIARQEEIERTNESKSVALVDGMAESKEPEEKRPSLVDRVHGLMDELNSKYVRVGRRSGGVTQRQSRRHRNRVLSARRSVLRFDSSPAPSQTAASPTRITTKHRHGHAGSSRKSKSQSKRKRKRKSE